MVASPDGAQILVQRSNPENSKAPADVSLWRLDDPKPVALKLPAGGNYRIQDFAPAAMIALSSNDNAGLSGELAIVPLDGKGSPRKLVVPGLNSVSAAKLSPDGKSAIVRGNFSKPGGKPQDDGEDYAIWIDIADGRIRQKFETTEEAFVTGFAFSPDGSQFALALRNGGAEIWDTAQGKKIKSLPRAKEDADARSIAFSPDGRSLIGAGMFDDDVFAWNIETGKIQRIYKMPNGLAGYRYATSVAASRDRKMVAAGLGQRAMSSGDIGVERGGILVWDADTGKLRHSLRSQRGAITALTFSAGDKYIVSGSLDGSIQYWDRNTGKPLATAVAGPNGKWIVLTEPGFYAGSEGSDDAVNVVRSTARRIGSGDRENPVAPRSGRGAAQGRRRQTPGSGKKARSDGGGALKRVCGRDPALFDAKRRKYAQLCAQSCRTNHADAAFGPLDGRWGDFGGTSLVCRGNCIQKRIGSGHTFVAARCRPRGALRNHRSRPKPGHGGRGQPDPRPRRRPQDQARRHRMGHFRR